MTKSDLMAKMAELNPHLAIRGLSNKSVKIFFDEITDALVRGDRVELRGLGAFWTKERAARKGRNPKSGDTVDVAPKRMPAFKMGKLLKEVLNPKKPS